jgi:hypothetical protein
MIVPQFINGGGWATTLFLTNVSSSSENYVIRFLNNSGASRQVSIQGRGTADTLSGTLAAGEVAVFETSDAGVLELGWAAVTPGTTTATRLNAFTVFRYHAAGAPDSEAIVTPGNLSDRSLVILYDNVNGFASGVALVNPNSTSLSLGVTIRRQDGGTIGSDTITLGPSGQTSFFTTDRYAATANSKGSLVISGNAGFAVVGLRFSPGFATFTSFPPLK